MSTLDELFVRLREATTPVEIETLQGGIWQLWLTTGEHSLDKHLEAGMRALSAGNYTQAITDFTSLIDLQPTYAEGWNKRATAYFLRGEYRASLADIRETLRREPRHFGALSGWANMLRALNDDRGLLRVLVRLEQLCPYWPGLQSQLRELRDRFSESEE
ncbi:tetratricopeptide repeat protein [uncultured Hymenobacter sp.]|uniref:tetratricopeptide repeat protein n=1 Tax=uncultured Hymenobacter sp. TaxID=170016 RepID=UPI0035CC4DA2